MGLVILVLLLISEPRRGIRNDLLLRKALRSVKERDFVVAEAAYSEILRLLDPRSARALRGMGSLHAAFKEDYYRAIEFYSKAVVLGDLPSLRMLVGMYIKTGQPEEIREYVPMLMRHKAENQEFLNAVLVYVIITKDQSLFDIHSTP